MEFIIVTGLNTGNKEEVRPNIHRSKRLLNKYFCGKTIITLVELESAFDACTVMEDKYKLGLVYILETVLRCKHHKINTAVFCLDVVDDAEKFNSYPWGRRCFLDTVHAFKRLHMMKGSKSDRKYDVYKFLLAMQVWTYENIPGLADKWTIRKERTRIPMMLNWQATDIPTTKTVTAILDDPRLDVHTVLTPTPEEMENAYIQRFYISSRVPYPILNAYLVGEEVEDQEVDTETEVRDHLEVETGVRTDMETEIETGQLDIETEWVINGELVVETNGMTNGVVTELETGGLQLAVETEQVETKMETGGTGGYGNQ
ncbi:Uncharacterized protein Adt_07876 [Abeliophyllum distichum]|uniref:DUF1985 domain-containing protein n=1 Tax=Abeliophyllum distichum TaxID=126358 RepID=A0ABD1VB03_9LAMI